jgi:hypothetical protein
VISAHAVEAAAAADAHVRCEPGGQHCMSSVAMSMFDDLAVVVADELDGAGDIPLGYGVHDVHPATRRQWAISSSQKSPCINSILPLG